MKILTMTSKQYHWLLPGFCYLFNEYWPDQRVVIGTDVAPNVDLPDNFNIYSYNNGLPLPAKEWSDGLKYALESIPGERVILMFEDYWLSRKVNNDKIVAIEKYVEYYPVILRFDLTTDRKFAGDARDWGTYAGMGLVTTPFASPYQFSLQAAMWNKHLLMQLLDETKSPWELEVHTQPPPRMRVLGTKGHIVKYVNVVLSGGEVEKKTSFEGVPKKHMDVLEERGWLEPN